MQLDKAVRQLTKLDPKTMLPGTIPDSSRVKEILDQIFSHSDFDDFSIPSCIKLKRGCYRQGNRIIVFFYVINGACRKLQLNYRIMKKGDPVAHSVTIAEQPIEARPASKSDLAELIKQAARINE